ncbi:hypothetical protein PanWU01x14_091050, partial [Parasponia andersonii]
MVSSSVTEHKFPTKSIEAVPARDDLWKKEERIKVEKTEKRRGSKTEDGNPRNGSGQANWPNPEGKPSPYYKYWVDLN